MQWTLLVIGLKAPIFLYIIRLSTTIILHRTAIIPHHAFLLLCSLPIFHLYISIHTGTHAHTIILRIPPIDTGISFPRVATSAAFIFTTFSGFVTPHCMLSVCPIVYKNARNNIIWQDSFENTFPTKRKDKTEKIPSNNHPKRAVMEKQPQSIILTSSPTE